MQRMLNSSAHMIVLRREENLSLLFHSSEGHTVDNRSLIPEIRTSNVFFALLNPCLVEIISQRISKTSHTYPPFVLCFQLLYVDSEMIPQSKLKQLTRKSPVLSRTTTYNLPHRCMTSVSSTALKQKMLKTRKNIAKQFYHYHALFRKQAQN